MLTDHHQQQDPRRSHEEEERGAQTGDARATVRELRIRNRQLTQSLQELEALCHMLAHDLRGPLQTITCFAQSLQQGEAGAMSEQGRHRLSRIVQGSLRMDAMIGELLDYGQAERAELCLREIDLGRLAREVADDLSPAYPKAAVHVGELPTAVCDGALVRRVLANLVSNALKFSAGRDAPEVTIRCVEVSGGIEVQVRDNGVGFDSAYADKLFGLFQRLHTRREFPGSGVGLAIVRSVVRRHGGSVRAESLPGATTFAFTLPRRVAAGAPYRH